MGVRRDIVSSFSFTFAPLLFFYSSQIKVGLRWMYKSGKTIINYNICKVLPSVLSRPSKCSHTFFQPPTMQMNIWWTIKNWDSWETFVFILFLMAQQHLWVFKRQQMLVQHSTMAETDFREYVWQSHSTHATAWITPMFAMYIYSKLSSCLWF